MNIKKIITGLALLMLLSSGAANADWGDVYYCKETNHAQITLDGNLTHLQLQKFQFKLDKARNAMAFGSGSYFDGSVKKILTDWSLPSEEFWYTKGISSTIYFDRGQFVFSNTGSNGIHIKLAVCDKF
jgi:hypothetical protein